MVHPPTRRRSRRPHRQHRDLRAPARPVGAYQGPQTRSNFDKSGLSASACRSMAPFGPARLFHFRPESSAITKTQGFFSLEHDRQFAKRKIRPPHNAPLRSSAAHPVVPSGPFRVERPAAAASDADGQARVLSSQHAKETKQVPPSSPSHVKPSHPSGWTSATCQPATPSLILTDHLNPPAASLGPESLPSGSNAVADGFPTRA